MRICSRCKKEQPLENFYVDIASKNGYSSACKECLKISKKEYRERNKAKIAEYNKEYKARKRKERAEKRRKYYEENKERLEEIAKEKAKIARKAWKKAHPLYRKNQKLKRRAAEKSAKIKVTTKELNELIENSKNICFWCGEYTENIHIDHIYPLAKGGDHSIYNLCVSCPTCNIKKGAKDPEIWLNEILSMPGTFEIRGLA